MQIYLPLYNQICNVKTGTGDDDNLQISPYLI